MPIRAGLSWISVLKQYGPEWREHRRALHQSFNSEAVAQYHPVQLRITRNFLRRLLTSPADMVDQLKLYACRFDLRSASLTSTIHASSFAAVTLLIAYGIEVVETDDEPYRMMERIAVIGEELTVPGRYAVDAIPALRFLPSWFPGASFQRYASDAKREITFIVDKLFNTAKVGLLASYSTNPTHTLFHRTLAMETNLSSLDSWKRADPRLPTQYKLDSWSSCARRSRLLYIAVRLMFRGGSWVLNCFRRCSWV